MGKLTENRPYDWLLGNLINHHTLENSVWLTPTTYEREGPYAVRLMISHVLVTRES